jgi:farnesyl diphosphate synthase
MPESATALARRAEAELKSLSERVDGALERWLPAACTHPVALHEAMRYAALGGGKRLRPALVYATGRALDLALERLDGVACAVELIHAYSLVHDDLPAMDDDDLRRGRPTCHKVFGEAMAILAGDALQALAFQVLAADPDGPADPAVRARLVETLALAAGSRGMAGGQAIDLLSAGREITVAELEDMHIHKTGALIRASVVMAALTDPTLTEQRRDRLDHFAKCLGLAFQIHDDVLDVEGDTETLGKPQGSDAAQDKPTYPSLLGLEESKALARELHAEALQALEPFGPRADLLRGIATYVVTRRH